MRQIIEKRRALAAPGVMCVEQGDTVQHDTIIAELDYIPGPMQRLDAARMLGISPELLEKKMRRGINERVNKGDVLAESEEFYYLREVISPLKGYVALWSKHQGYLYLRSMTQQVENNIPVVFRNTDASMSKDQFIADFIPSAQLFAQTGHTMSTGEQIVVMVGQRLFKSNNIVAPFSGRVSFSSEEEFCIVLTPLFQLNQLKAHLEGVVRSIPEPGVCIIASYGHRFLGTVGYGDERSGILHALSTMYPSDRDLREEDVVGDLTDCIVISSKGASLAALHKLALAQVAGLVLGSLDIEVLAEFSGQDPLKQLGQLMTLPFPVILLKGYEGAMLKETWQEMISLIGRHAIIDASTQLRAGVARPELLVPLAEEISAHKEELLSEKVDISVSEQLQQGDRVLLLRDPCAGQVATLLSLGTRLQETASGTRTVLAEVRLTGIPETLFVPLVNCQKIDTGGEDYHGLYLC